ncbi:MAG: hypothetical protein LC102_08885 [Ignavibacteriales bacterium]|nr:MAG: hypothetical protein F9K26_05190 [Ignavibacteriaceae bacterium]MBW7872809.1 hypothetical protein [Ignavibacteria bacterium]MCZ2143528.1 hypothetical protein [Ignavibacteriales bacterium]OQY71829.1 MAG: hypothetical protein B6D45_09640 [Ignavibacteriales bacterium UTCHB3]MBV6444405.1 hypothetical protein [Ignavibacteriaceae bacterium]
MRVLVTVIFAVLSVCTVSAQGFIPGFEWYQQKQRKFITDKKIESLNANRYETAADGIPGGRLLSKSTVHFYKSGYPASVFFKDSTGGRLDSIFLNAKNEPERIIRYTVRSDTTSPIPYQRLLFNRDEGGKLLNVHLFDVNAGKVTAVFDYGYTKDGKLATVMKAKLFDSEMKDSTLWQFDKNERATLFISGNHRTEYKYDGAGNLIEEKFFEEGALKTTTKYVYGKTGFPIKSTVTGKGFNSESEYLYSQKGFLILTKTKSDYGTKTSAFYSTEIREYFFFQ